MRVFLGGSKQIGKLPECALLRIDEYIDRECEFIVGDCHGVDLVVQKYLYSRGVRNVIVFCSGVVPRYNVGNWAVAALNNSELSGYEFYKLKDERMIQDAYCGLMIWNGKSKGTAQNIECMKRLGKPIEVVLA